MTAVADRVAAGAAFLDEHDPEWWRADVERAIDLGLLAMNSGSLDVLGQRCDHSEVAGSFPPSKLHAFALTGETGLVALARRMCTLGLSPADVAELGECDRLTAEWRRVIEARRAS